MLASLDDLAALGALRDNTTVTDKYGQRATRLLVLASAQVVTYAEYVDEAAMLADITATQATALSAVVAEVAAQRLNVTASPSTQPYEYSGIPMWALLNRGHMRAIDNILNKAGRGSVCDVVVRDADSSSMQYWFPVLSSDPDFDTVPT